MKTLICAGACLALVLGTGACKPKKKAGTGSATGSGSAAAKGSAAGTGSAAAGTGSAAAGTGSAAAGTGSAAAGTGSAAAADLKAAMKQHYVKAVATRDLVIAGKLAEAKAAAKAIVTTLPADKLPVPWRAHIGATHAAAKQMAAAGALEAAGLGVAAIAGACGSCHTKLKAKIKVSEQPLVAGGNDTKSHMARHAWAARRLWEGLAIPSPDHWTRGTVVLAEKALVAGSIAALKAKRKKAKKKATKADIKQVETLAKQVHSLAAQAAKAKADMRAPLFGQLLATCAGCHQLTRD